MDIGVSKDVFYILFAVQLLLASLVTLLYSIKKTSKKLLFFVVLFSIFVQAFITPGGYDFGVYDNLVKNNLLEYDLIQLFSFFSTEFFVYPFFTISAYFDLSFRYGYIFSVIALLLIVSKMLIPKENKVDYLILLTLLLSSPAAPFLFGNVIRQGLASMLLIALPFVAIQQNIFKISILSLFLHRSSFIFVIIYRLIFLDFVKRITLIALGLVIFLVMWVYAGDTLLEIYYFYNYFENLSYQRTVLRSLFFISPFIPLMFLPFKWNNAHIKNALFFVFMVCFTVLGSYIALKIGDRLTYYLIPVLLPFIYLHRDNPISYVSSFFILASSSLMIFFDGYSSLFSRIL